MRGDTTQGRRVYPDGQGYLRLAPGDYGKNADGVWKARAPRCSMGSLEAHEVIEHPDGTITVTPSIEITQPDPGKADGPPVCYWHGFLDRGVWRED